MQHSAHICFGATRVVASPDAAAFIRQRGGLLFVRARRHGCGALTLLDAATEPLPAREYVHLPAEGFAVLLAPSRHPLPAEIHVELRGLLRRRIEAYWNGCAYVMDEQATDVYMAPD